MTWTYAGTPGTSTAAERRDAVRMLVGDTDTTDQQVTDEEITFALAQAGDDVYLAASIIARTIAASYARLVDVSVDSVRSAYSQRQKGYLDLASRMEVESKKRGSAGLGVPLVGGVSISDMEAVREDTDRVSPSFKRNQFRNPPLEDEGEYNKS